MFNLEKTCPVCESPMSYRPLQSWTGMRNQTNVHEWFCFGRAGDSPSHTLKFYEPSTQEYREWEKHK